MQRTSPRTGRPLTSFYALVLLRPRAAPNCSRQTRAIRPTQTSVLWVSFLQTRTHACAGTHEHTQAPQARGHRHALRSRSGEKKGNSITAATPVSPRGATPGKITGRGDINYAPVPRNATTYHRCVRPSRAKCHLAPQRMCGRGR